MEEWLSRQTIPFERINATIGKLSGDDCVAGKQEPRRCRGIAGLSMTELDIIRNHDVSDLTVVLEDDYELRRPVQEIVEETLRIVPSDWDVIRWNCWGPKPNAFDVMEEREVKRSSGRQVFRSVTQQATIAVGLLEAPMPCCIKARRPLV